MGYSPVTLEAVVAVLWADLPPVERLQLSELVRSSVEEQDESVDEEALQKFRELKHRMMLLDRAELGCQPLTPQGDRNHTPPHPLPLINRYL